MTTHGLSYVAALVYKGNEMIPGIDFYPPTLFHASDSAANVSVGQNTISVLGNNRYVISGASSNGRLRWNLNYVHVAPSWFAGDRVNVGPLAWEQMSWLLYMPRAAVSGTLTIDGQTYRIESSGYHDHNWGEWDFSAINWNWAQYSSRV
jgi:predicted secreted hydrolase